MAQVTVDKLAQTVGTSVDRLLKQMKEAGLSHSSADDSVSDEEKQTLLGYLKGLHGAVAIEPKKITLRRKTLTTLRSANRKTVNIEVRKKRTYVKRSDDENNSADKRAISESADTGSVAVGSSVATSATDEIEAKRVAAIESRIKAEEEEKKKAEEAIQPKTEETEKSESTINPEGASTNKSDRSTRVSPDPQPVTDSAPEKGRRSNKKVDDDDIMRRAKRPIGKSAKKKPRLVMDEVADEGRKKMRLKSGIAAPLKIDNKHTFQKPTQKIILEVSIPNEITVAQLASNLNIKAGIVVKELMKLGLSVSINENIDQETAFLLVEELGHTPVAAVDENIETELAQQFDLHRESGKEAPRAPIVTVMGHVDHGKTSLLDYIRETHVASDEAGGITQHIGAYHVRTSKGIVTFLDTPGHAAFTAMRARGAKSTDVVILVVAADDGVMPQTEEAIQHAKAADVPIIVALNKIDKENADPEKVMTELGAKDVIPEEWGGDTQFIRVSAQTGDGIDDLLEAILLQAELLELTAVYDGPASGVIVESRIDKSRGVIATALVQQGNLCKGDFMLAGETVGKIRAMTNEANQSISEAGPSIPLEILGLDDAPNAGDEFFIVSDERKAKEIAEVRHDRAKAERNIRQQAIKLENMFSDVLENAADNLRVVVKTDVRGSLEALTGALNDFATDEVAVDIVASGIGGITESDINLAITTGAIVLGFNVRMSTGARSLSEKEKVEVRYYSVIYNLLDEVKQALSGMLSPESRETIVGVAEVRDIFKSPKYGLIAGCMVLEGTVHRSKPIRVLRDNVVIFQGELESLRRFKDDTQEVRNGMECGIGVRDYNDVRVGDSIEVYDITKVQRSL